MITQQGNPLFQPLEAGVARKQPEQEQPGIQQGRSDGGGAAALRQGKLQSFQPRQ